MKRTTRTIPLLALVAALALATAACGSADPTAAPEAAGPAVTAAATEAPAPTDAPAPTATAEPTATVEPTETDTPMPTATPKPTAIPEPVTLTGTGDSVVDAEGWQCQPGLVHITGNAGGRFFAVENFDADGERLELLANTTDPYDGWRPLDWMDDECTTRFQVQGAGEWSITLLPLAPIPEVDEHRMEIPGTYEGEGDDVIILAGAANTPDLANVSGNADGRFFAVMAWTAKRGSDQLLINTVDPYEGTVILDPMTLAIEVRAVGAWTVEVTTK